MTQGGKKSARGRKPAATKGRKTKAKKDEAVEILEDELQTQEPAPEKPARGLKRTSDAMEDPAATDAEAPVPKRRATRVGASTARGTRKVSQSSVRSQASTASLRANPPDDDEIERQLEADLERYQTDEDLAADSESDKPKKPSRAKGRPKKAATARKTGAQTNVGSEAYAMFDPTPVEPDEAEIEAEFKTLEAEMASKPAAAAETLEVPKKGRKAGTRKASKQTKKTREPIPQPVQADQEMDVRAEHPEPVREPVPRQVQQPLQELGEEPGDDPIVSTGSAAIGTLPMANPNLVVPSPARVEKTLPAPPASADRLPHSPATPRSRTTPSASARQAAISPSQSPQSSDAENRPPSSKAAASVVSKRVVLGPATVSATPIRRSSPTKHSSINSRSNIIAGLQSTTPWQAADLDLLFSPTSESSGDKENGVARLLRRGAELTSPEKRMTVEEWIYHNAGLAELKLKHECEAMVSAFEREGSRAIRVLEGLVVE